MNAVKNNYIRERDFGGKFECSTERIMVNPCVVGATGITRTCSGQIRVLCKSPGWLSMPAGGSQSETR